MACVLLSLCCALLSRFLWLETRIKHALTLTYMLRKVGCNSLSLLQFLNSSASCGASGPNRLRWGLHRHRGGHHRKKCNKVPWAVTDKGNICVTIYSWTKRKKKGGGGVQTHMLVVENTHEKVVGTVHLVTNENFFVAKSSAPLTVLYGNPALPHSDVLR